MTLTHSTVSEIWRFRAKKKYPIKATSLPLSDNLKAIDSNGHGRMEMNQFIDQASLVHPQ